MSLGSLIIIFFVSNKDIKDPANLRKPDKNVRNNDFLSQQND